MAHISELQIPFDTVKSVGIRVLEPEILGRFESGGQGGGIRISVETRPDHCVAGVSVLSNREVVIDPLPCSFALGVGITIEDAFWNLLVCFHESIAMLRKMAPKFYALNVKGSTDEAMGDLINWLCQRLIVNPNDPLFTSAGITSSQVYEGCATLDLGTQVGLVLSGQIHQTSLQRHPALIAETMIYQSVEHEDHLIQFPFSRFVFGGYQNDVTQWYVKNLQFLEGAYVCLKQMLQKQSLSEIFINKGCAP